MNDQQLIKQLKSLKNIHPDESWVALMRSNLAALISQNQHKSAALSLANLLNFSIPRPVAVSILASIVALVGGITIVQEANYNGGVFVASVRSKSLSIETREEIKEIAAITAEQTRNFTQNRLGSDEHETAELTVVFDEDSDKQENFKKALRNRIESKIGRIKDLFAQLEDGDLAREISLNPRRFEENFKLADAELGEQVKSLLLDAEAALAEGNLIDALDLVNAIDKLLESN